MYLNMLEEFVQIHLLTSRVLDTPTSTMSDDRTEEEKLDWLRGALDKRGFTASADIEDLVAEQTERGHSAHRA